MWRFRAAKSPRWGRPTASQDLPAARERLDAQGDLVLPGLVNTHCHAPMVWFRGLADDLPLQQWLTEFIFPAEGGWLDADKVYRGTLLAAAEMIRGGITTVADGYFFEAAVRRALSDAGLRAVVAQGVVDFPAPGVPDPARNLEVAAEFLDSGAAYRDRLTSAVFCHSPYTCGPETLQKAKDLTRARGAPFFLHLAETREEVASLKRRTGRSPVAYLDHLGLLDDLTVAVHAVWLEPPDLELLAHRGVKVSHCPESNLKLAAGVAPIPALLKLGVTVGLGTDGAASNNNLDLWGEMSLAARLHKVWGHDPTLMPAARVVALATREGARVLGLGETTGTLAPGKAADLIVVAWISPTSPRSTTLTRIWSMRPGAPMCGTSWWAAAGSSGTGSSPPWIGPRSPVQSGPTAGTWPLSAGNSGRRPEPTSGTSVKL